MMNPGTSVPASATGCLRSFRVNPSLPLAYLTRSMKSFTHLQNFIQSGMCGNSAGFCPWHYYEPDRGNWQAKHLAIFFCTTSFFVLPNDSLFAAFRPFLCCHCGILLEKAAK